MADYLRTTSLPVFSPSSLRVRAVFLLMIASAAGNVCAQGTHLWTQSRFEEFEKGTPQGVSISSDGHLRAAPGLSEVATTPSTFVWSVAADKSGTAFLGTGSPATVLRVASDGKPVVIFKTKDVAVQVVRVGPDGSLYAATLPSGKVYKLNPAASEAQDESSATVVFDMAKADGAQPAAEKKDEKSETTAHYIWDIVFDAQGRLYIAAGGPAAVYRIDPKKPGAAAESFFKSDEAHLRTLAWDGNGNLLAGSEGSGLVYRIGPDGKGYVLFESPRREVTSLAVGADGTIYAASVGGKGRNPLPQLPVQSQGNISMSVAQPASLSAANTSGSIPEGSEIDAIQADQAPRKIWAGKDDVIYALVSRPDGLLALTGNRGRVLHIGPDGSFADLGHLSAQQGLSLTALAGSGDLLIGTGNTGKLVRMSAATEHEYASDVLDAGAFARFGRIEVETGSTGYKIETRTGNIEQPVRGWTEWQPLKDGAVASPAGRYLQWKARLDVSGVLGSVGVNYLPVNTAPVVEEVVVAAGARWNAQGNPSGPATVSIALNSAGQSPASFDSGNSSPLQAMKDKTAVTVRWGAHDEDGDELTYSVYLRGDGETVWRLLKDKLTEKAYSFDATRIPDGGYAVKVVASDAPTQNPGEALTGEKTSARFVIDTTPPVVNRLKATGSAVQCSAGVCSQHIEVVFDAEDATSPIAKAEYSIDGGAWQYIAPVGKLSDSLKEHYDFHVSAAESSARAEEHLITVRAWDRYENVGVAKTVLAGQGQ